MIITKFVYVVASSVKDIYLEQAIVSAWTLRYYNPDAHILLVCDSDTRQLLDQGWQREYVTLFDEYIVCPFEENHSLTYRSRVIKTTLRSLVKGDFLYVDTDTVICDDLHFIDDFTFDLGFVPDNNCSFDKVLHRDSIVSEMRKCYAMDVTSEKEYYNGGVFYVKDTELTHTFFSNWYNNWLYEIEHTHSMKDQQPLMKTNIDMGYVITEMPGKLNCQIAASICYLHNAAIIHIYNCCIHKDQNVTPFHSLDTYRRIKEEGFTNEWKDKAIHFKELFSSPSVILGESNSHLWRKINSNGYFPILDTYTVMVFSKIYKRCPLLFRVIEMMFKLTYKLLSYLK